jgi:long-subunit fatty acid transport protein
MLRRAGTSVGLLALGILVGWNGQASAQTDDESNGAVQFNFSTPGARSLALGGAFLGSVDDATAAYSNPAGLLQLSEPEISAEVRRWNFSTPFADRGRASGTPTGLGVDTLAGIEEGTAETELDGLSFASIVYPRPKWALALYYHQVAKFEADFETGGIFAGEGLNTRRLFPVRSSYDLDISQAGVAWANRWDKFAVGVSASLYKLELASTTQRFLPETFFSAPDFVRDVPLNFQTQSGDAEEVGYSVGLRWDLSPRTSVGMVYRYGPEFEIDVLSSTRSPEVSVPPREIIADDTAVFNLPDVVGLGLSFRPVQSLTINLDAHHVQYSELVEELFLFFETEGGRVITAQDFVIDDVTEVHLGLEYVFARSPIPVAVRLGGWYDPDHRLRAETGSELNQARLFAGEDQIHAAAGLGLVITSHFQVDVAVDVSDTSETASVSTVYRF